MTFNFYELYFSRSQLKILITKKSLMLLKLEVFPLLTTFMILTSVGVLTNPRGMSVNMKESSDVNALHQSHGEMEAYTPHKSDYTIAIDGSIHLGYYYATFFLGYPPQKQTFIVDTGSSITAVPCSGKKNIQIII